MVSHVSMSVMVWWLTRERRLRSLLLTSVLVFGLLTGTSFVLQFLGVGSSLPAFHSVVAGLGTQLGVDCGLGSTQAVPDPVTGIPVGDGTFDTTCNWVGDIDADGIPDPLVSDNPVTLPAGTGGGFTAEVRVTGLTGTFNGFDVQLGYDTKYLDAVKIDQSGLVFGGDPTIQACFGTGGCSVFPLTSTIDRSTGQIRLAEVLLGTSSGPGSPDGLVDETLFRVRFDVVGVGHSPLDLHDDLIVLASDQIAHTTQDGAFESVSFFDPTGGLAPEVSWTFAPNPEVPGSDLKFTATAACSGCGALSYSWDTNSDGASDASGASPTITPPTTTLVVNRVVLTVSDGTNTFTATRRLPLTVNVQGPATIAANTPQTWTGLWLGGIAPYTGSWRFCPGTGSTANLICAKPAPTIASTPGQTNPQLLSAGTGPGAYHFAGIYTDSLKITDTVSQQIATSPATQTFTFQVEVTGSPAAFTVTVTNPAKSNVGAPVTITATIAYDSTYPTTPTNPRSSSFDVTFDFGDGSTPVTIPKTGCSILQPPASACTVSTDHTFTTKGSHNIRVKAAETATTAVSKIQETGASSVTVNPPTLTGDFTISDSNPNVNAEVTFTTTGVSGGTSPYSYSWDFGDGSPAGSGAMVTHSYSSGGSKTVVLTVTDANNAQVAPSHNVSVKVTKVPLCDVSVGGCDFIFDPTSPTVGKPVTFTATANGGTPPYGFSWRFGDGSGPSTTNPATHIYAAAGPFTVTLTITDSFGTPQTQTVPHQLTVAVQPPNLNVVVSCGSATAGKPVTCTATATGGSGGYTFTWSVDGNPQAGQTGSSFTTTFPTKGSRTIRSDVTDSSQATDFDQTTVNVAGQLLQADFTFSPSNPGVGVDITFTATASGGTSGYTFSWAFGDGQSVTGATVHHSYSAKSTGAGYVVALTVTDSNDVQTTAHHNVVVVGTPLTADFTVGTVTVGKPVTFTATVSGGTGPYSYSWSFGDGGSGTGASAQHSFANKGRFTVTLTVTDANGVSVHPSHLVTVTGQQLTVTISASPSATAGKPVSFTATVSGGTGPYTVNWSFDDGSQGLGATTIHSYAVKGSYDVTASATDANQVTVSAPGMTVVVSAQTLQVSVSSVSCNSATADKPLTCTATVSGGTPGYTYEWSLDGVVQVSQFGAIFTTSFPVKGSHEIHVNVTDANNAFAEYTAGVTVVGQPLHADFTASNSNPDVDIMVSFDATVTGGTLGYAFSWSFGDGAVATGNPVDHAYSSNGRFVVDLTLTDANGASATASHTVVVGVVELLSADFTFSAATVGKPMSFSASATGGVPAYSFAWNFGDGNIGEEVGPDHSYGTKGSFTVVLTVTDSVGTEAMATRVVTVAPQPLAASITSSTARVGQPVSFSAVISGSTPPYDVSWDFGDSGRGSGLATQHTYSAKGGFRVQITVTDLNAVTTTALLDIVVEPQALAVDFVFTPALPMANESVTFTATASGGTGPYEFSWTFGDGATGSVGIVSHAYSNDGRFDVSLSVIDFNGVTLGTIRTIVVGVPSGPRALLTFNAYDADSFENGLGELQVYSNGVLVADIPAGINGLTGTGKYQPYDDTSVNFGPFDITAYVTDGTNALVFLNPLSSHNSLVFKVRVVQGDVVLLQNSKVRSVSPDQSARLTFSRPPLVIDSFTVSHSIFFDTERRTFTATFSGGVGAFKCTFSFGDGDSKSVSAIGNTCSASHTYWGAKLRTATVRVRGVNTSDDVRKSMSVRVEPQPGYTEEGLVWSSTIQLGSDENFTAKLTNPSSQTLLVRVDLTATRPDGLKDKSKTSFPLSTGQTMTDLTFSYTPTDGTGTYCFSAPLKYGVDTSGNGVLEDSEVLGGRSAMTGCFTVDSASQSPLTGPIILGLSLVPAAVKPVGNLRPRKKNDNNA